MKVLGINSSPRKHWNSATLMENAVKGAESKGAASEIIHLADLSFSGCRSCFACKLKDGDSLGRCAVKDDLTQILERILDADALVISMPIYFGDVPGIARNLFERLWFPCYMYRNDGVLAYNRRIKTLLIYTMNAKDESLYWQLMEDHRSKFNFMIGDTEIMCSTDTLQFEDYGRYVGNVFNPQEKLHRHNTVFRQDCGRAFSLGKELV